MKDSAAVRLTAVAEVPFGADLVLCGSAPALGSWDIAGAAPMKWHEGGRWLAEVALPCGVLVEMKVVVRNQGTYKWYGAGPTQEANVALETSLARDGARGSHLVDHGVLPFGLEVEDIAEVTTAAAGNGTAPTSQEVAVRGAAPPQPSAPPTAYAPQAPAPESHAAMMLAGAAAHHGRAVTYTTTTVTTTAVTINGDGAPPPGHVPAPQVVVTQHPGAPGGVPGQACLPPSGAPPQGALPAPPVAGAKSSPQPEATPAQMEALMKARAMNEGLPRLGPVVLTWPGEAQAVCLRGSWDSWGRDLAMEPSPTGGFRLLLVLPPGEYEFKFIVDGKWTTSSELETTKCANKNNVVRAGDVAIAPFMPPPEENSSAIVLVH